MTMPFIPDENDMDREKSINLLLTSIAFEELGLAHIIRAEAEKIKHVLEHGTPEVEDLLKINKSVERMLRKVIMKEMLLSFKLEDVLELAEMENEKDDDDHHNGDDDDH